MPEEQVIRLAREAHAANWRLSGDESTGDKLAARITAEWQKKVQEAFGSRFQPEHPVADGLRERIDLVDLRDGVVSQNWIVANLTLLPGSNGSEVRRVFDAARGDRHLGGRWQLR